MRVTLTETTVAELSGVRVGLSRVWEEDWEDASGRPAHGVRATLSVMGDDPEDDFDQRVGLGDLVTVAGEVWRVVSVSEPPEGLGSVVVETGGLLR